MLADQISSMILVLGISQILKRYDLTTPQAVMTIRIMYFSSQAVQLLVWFYVRHLIRTSKKEDESQMLEITEPAKPFSNEPPKKTRKSVRDYDLEAVAKNINGIYSQVVIMGFLHFYFKFTQPLIFQSLLPWKALFMMPVVQIRLLGFKAEGSLARPWKAPNPFGDLMAQMDDNAAAKKDDDAKKEAIEESKDSEKEEESSGVKARKPRKEE